MGPKSCGNSTCCYSGVLFLQGRVGGRSEDHSPTRELATGVGPSASTVRGWLGRHAEEGVRTTGDCKLALLLANHCTT